MSEELSRKGFYLYEEDLKLLDRLSAHFNIMNSSALVRFLLKRAADEVLDEDDAK